MAIVLPSELADRIQAWMRGDPDYAGMRLEDLLSDEDLMACVVALREPISEDKMGVYDDRMNASEQRGMACQSLEIAKTSILAAAIGACDCNTKSNDPMLHQAYCRWLKLLTALERLETVADHLSSP